MKQDEIKKSVELEIRKWTDLNRMREREIAISPNAFNFIVELISNIETDPPRLWKSQHLDFDYSQHLAISLIPNALNDVMRSRGLRTFRHGEIEISTWDLWLSLSEIIKNWCFIPRDI